MDQRLGRVEVSSESIADDHQATPYPHNYIYSSSYSSSDHSSDPSYVPSTSGSSSSRAQDSRSESMSENEKLTDLSLESDSGQKLTMSSDSFSMQKRDASTNTSQEMDRNNNLIESKAKVTRVRFIEGEISSSNEEKLADESRTEEKSSGDENPSRVYVDNAFNRKIGRVGLPYGSKVVRRSDSFSSDVSKSDHSMNEKSTYVKYYVDNEKNRLLCRVGLPYVPFAPKSSSNQVPNLSQIGFRKLRRSKNDYVGEVDSGFIEKSYSSVLNQSTQTNSSFYGDVLNFNKEKGKKAQAVDAVATQTEVNSFSDANVKFGYWKQEHATELEEGCTRNHQKEGEKLFQSILQSIISNGDDDEYYDLWGTKHGRNGGGDSLNDTYVVSATVCEKMKPSSATAANSVKLTLSESVAVEIFEEEHVHSKNEQCEGTGSTEWKEELPRICNSYKNPSDWNRTRNFDSENREEYFKSLFRDSKFVLIDSSRIQLGEVIGSGGFAEVRRGKWNPERKPVAVKSMDSAVIAHSKLDLFIREVGLLCNLHHENVVQFYGACMERQKYWIVMELMETSLFETLHVQDEMVQFSEAERVNIIKQIVNGLHYLHSNKTAHCDLKTSNVLLNGVKTDRRRICAKLTDFGLSLMRREGETSADASDYIKYFGTPFYSAPEVLRGELLNYAMSKRADIFSVSLVIYEIVFAKMAFSHLNLRQMQRQVGDLGMQPFVPSDAKLTRNLKDIFEKCWNMKAESRPNAQQLKTMVESMNRLFVVDYSDCL